MLRIGELATKAGVSVRALRYYEEQGLLAPERSPGGQRHYDETDVMRVRFFQQMYGAGLSSRNIAVLLPCVETGQTDAEQRSMLDEQRARIQARLDDLQDALTRLDRVIEVTGRRRPADSPGAVGNDRPGSV